MEVGNTNNLTKVSRYREEKWKYKTSEKSIPTLIYTKSTETGDDNHLAHWHANTNF